MEIPLAIFLVPILAPIPGLIMIFILSLLLTPFYWLTKPYFDRRYAARQQAIRDEVRREIANELR